MQLETQRQILKMVVEFAESALPLDLDVERLRRAFPFHAPFFTDEGLRAFKVQRNIVTRLGQVLIPRIAELIARDKYQKVHREHPITGQVDEGMMARIQQIVNDLRAGRRQPNAQKEWEEILGSASNRMVPQQVVADLYVEDFEGGPLFVEIKSPRPNLDICAETKRKMLTFRAMMLAMGQPQAKAYMGLWYNPDIDREKYSHLIVRRVMDMSHEVLLGEELWDTIGGPGTYDEILEIMKKAEQHIRKREGRDAGMAGRPD